MNINNINSPTDVLSYVQDLCSKPYPEQLKEAQERIGAPLDYAPNDTVEETIKSNTDLLASYFREYELELKNNPDILKEYLAQKLGEEFIEMMGRNSK